MARGPVAVGIPGWTTALAGTEGTRVQGESEYRCTMGRQAARRPQSTGTRPAADAGRLESTITSTLRLVSEPGSRSDRCRNNPVPQIGRAHDRTPVTNAHHVCRLM